MKQRIWNDLKNDPEYVIDNSTDSKIDNSIALVKTRRRTLPNPHHRNYIDDIVTNKMAVVDDSELKRTDEDNQTEQHSSEVTWGLVVAVRQPNVSKK